LNYSSHNSAESEASNLYFPIGVYSGSIRSLKQSTARAYIHV